MSSKKSTYKRPGYRSCGKMVYSDAKKALALARATRRLLNIEVKNHDVQQNLITLTSAPVIIQLSNIPQGDTTISRDGNQCKMSGLQMDYIITQHASAITTHVRVLLVLDKQTNQAVYTNTDLLQDVTIRDNLVSPRNLDNMKRFTVLYDKTHVLTSGGVRSVSVRRYFRKEVLLRFDASTPSIADLTQNSISFMQFADEATNLPTIVSCHRLRFIDN